jgi:6-pyruvoyl-tetrahydropterin synthase
LGSGGLLFIDPVQGIDKLFENNKDCVYIDYENHLEQIRNILDNYDDHYLIRYSGLQKSKQYDYENWAKNIYDKFLVDLLPEKIE